MSTCSNDTNIGTEREIERALQGVAKTAIDDKLPLLERLTTIGEEVTALISRYSATVRSIAEDGLEAPPPPFESIRAEYEQLFASCTFQPAQAGVVRWHRQMIVKGRPHYEEAAARTGVPWWFIAIVHGMEASFNFQAHLHNGDPLSARTVQVPHGRPPVWLPPSDWLSSAIDALRFEGFAGAADWSIPRALYRWESYNGWGYRRLGIHTPYLWSYSNHYSKGKFVKDGKYDPNAVSKQCGAAVMLKALQDAGLM